MFIQILLNVVVNGPIDDRPTLVQVMAWRRGEKLLSELMTTQFTDTYIFVPMPQRVKTFLHPGNGEFCFLQTLWYGTKNLASSDTYC